MTTGIVYHEIYFWHDPGHAALDAPPSLTVQPDQHVSDPAPKRRLLSLAAVSGVLDVMKVLKPRPAARDELLQFHSETYIDRIKGMSDSGGGEAGESTRFGAGSFEIASLAAGGAIVAAEAVARGDVRNAYALVRPPGHHAEADRGRGYCIFNNVAIATKIAKAKFGVGRVAIIDWDVHHGNGTQAAFWTDPEVLTISIHQDDWYPNDLGGPEEVGAGPGVGSNLNVQLPAGSGHDAYMAAMTRVVAPALRRFGPDLIVVACGFDASILDPLGRMMLTSQSYREMTGVVMGLAEELCQSRLLLCDEGGYSSSYVPYCGLAVFEELTGYRSSIEDPYISHFAALKGQKMNVLQETAIAEAEKRASQVPAIRR